jgi:hypothetical protein
VTCHESEQFDERRIREVRESVGSYMFSSDYEAVFGDTDEQLFTTASVRGAFTADVRPLFGGA